MIYFLTVNPHILQQNKIRTKNISETAETQYLPLHFLKVRTVFVMT